MKENTKKKKSPFSKAKSEGASSEEVATPNKQQFAPSNKFESNMPTGGGISNTMAAMSLRALFGTNEDLGIEQLLKKASSLKNVANVGILSRDEVRSLDVIHKHHLGLSECRDLQLVCSSGNINFVGYGNTTLVVVSGGVYAPGTEDALSLIAQRIDELQ